MPVAVLLAALVACGPPTTVRVSADGKPVPGFSFRVDGWPATTNASGVATIRGLAPGDHTVALPAEWWTDPRPLHVDDNRRASLDVVRLCPGIVRVVDGAGAPVAGALVKRDDLYDGNTDARGEVDLPGRRCHDFATVWVDGQPQGFYMRLSAHEPRDVVLHEVHSAEVTLTSDIGPPADPTLRGVAAVERLDDGVFRVSARADDIYLSAHASSCRPTHANLPLDGARHTVTLECRSPRIR